MNTKNALRFGAIPAGLLGAFGAANAAVPQEITDAISTMQADGVTVATAFVVAAIAVAAIKFLRSAK
ncbi:major capsid protein [Oryzisolibacter sp. LB2S]|uniref:major capsid protein n=1 Tax=Alicycliphilus soli TaxID=3228789 RepID=UPI00345A1276